MKNHDNNDNNDINDNNDNNTINDNNTMPVNSNNIEEETDDYSNKEIAKKLLGSYANVIMYLFFGMFALIITSIGYGLYLGFFSGTNSYLDFNIIKSIFS